MKKSLVTINYMHIIFINWCLHNNNNIKLASWLFEIQNIQMLFFLKMLVYLYHFKN